MKYLPLMKLLFPFKILNFLCSGKKWAGRILKKSSVKILPMTTSRSLLQKCRTRKHLPKQSLTVWYFLSVFQNIPPFMTGNWRIAIPI